MPSARIRWGTLLLALAATAAADEPKPATFTAKKAPFKVETALEGIFEPQDMAEVAYKPEVWSELKVLKGVAHGATVKAGDPLFTADFKAIDEAIQEMESEQGLTTQALRRGEEELPLMEKALPLEMAAVDQAKTRADEDLKRFTEVDRPRMVKQADMGLRESQFQLESAQEELNQLQKMYRAGEATEETEEIILKRQRFAVEYYTLSLENARVDHQQFMDIFLPRQATDLSHNALQQALLWDKVHVLTPMDLMLKRMELAKAKLAASKAQEKLDKLRKDRQAMALAAPADGTVYYGRFDHGKWAADDGVAQVMKRGGNLAPHQVFLTIVKSRPIVVRAAVPEKELHGVKEGLKAKVVPAGYPDLKLAATVESITPLPSEPGMFGAKLSLNGDNAAVVPGMACSVKLMSYQNPAALTVPSKAVFTDDLDDDKRYVLVFKAGSPPDHRAVMVGQESGDTVEILSGLAEGDEILQEKPKS